MKKLEVKLKKILNGKNTPLFGNSRSLSIQVSKRKASKRKFQGNIQKFKIDNKTYRLRTRDFRSFRAIKPLS